MKQNRKKIVAVSVVIREFRQSCGFSQDQLADRMDVSTPYISMLESGKRYPSIETLIRIAKALGIMPGEMLDRIAELHAQERKVAIDRSEMGPRM